MTDGPKILTIDIETRPNLAYVWGLFDQNVGLSQIEEHGQVISFAAKWYHDNGGPFQDGVIFRSDYHDGHDEMVFEAHELFDEADIIVHWNGRRFDVPHLNREFLLAGLSPPSPHKDVDLLLTAKRKFKFVSNKLDNVAHEVLGERKVKHDGFELWLACMRGDGEAWAKMREYNIKDTLLTERLYDALRPWIPSHPHFGLYTDDAVAEVCSRCGSDDLQKRGYARTALGKYQRYQCNACGGWSRGAKRLSGQTVRGEN